MLSDIIPALNFLAVTPSNSVNLPTVARALYIGVGGDVTCVNESGAAVLFKNLQTGTILPVFTSRVNSTATTASSIVALY